MTHGRSEVGETLIEVLIALAILGVVVAGMVGALGTSIFASDVHQQESIANTVLVSTAELAKSASYSPCWTLASSYTRPVYENDSVHQWPSVTTELSSMRTQGSLGRNGSAWSASNITIAVAYWNTQTQTWDAPTPPTAAPSSGVCHDDPGSATPFPMQLLTVTVTSPDGRGTASTGVIKRGP